MTVVVVFSLDQEAKEVTKSVEQLSGKLQMQFVEDKLMHSVLQSDKKTLDHADLLEEAANQNIGAFTPDMMYSQMVKNFSVAEQIMGKKLLRLITGYDPNYVRKNLNIPEFQKELRTRINKKVQELKDEGLLDYDGVITEKGHELASMMLIQHLDKFVEKESTGEKRSKKVSHYGDIADSRAYKKRDRYKDINVRKTVSRAVKRTHEKIMKEDLVTNIREGKASISIIYAIDASSSMKGEKLESSKKAGISLAHRAIDEKNKVGLIVFGSEVEQAIPPTQDFGQILNAMSRIKASKQTDFKKMINKAIELFPPRGETKHLVVLTDALPTVGKKPEKETLESASMARAAGLTLSIVGMNLDKKGEKLARELSIIGEGKLSLVKKLDDLGNIVLEDYYAFR
ncbi:VWA domain-containing protein [Candidatus Woesearchaeota archaeon]|nr:VWA domain-containing protein [Candidatus Woesearchaeota archaeon]